MAKDSKAKVKKVKNSKDSKPKSNNSGISKSEPFAPEAHPFIKKLAANGTYTPLSSLVPVLLTNKSNRPSYERQSIRSPGKFSQD